MLNIRNKRKNLCIKNNNLTRQLKERTNDNRNNMYNFTVQKDHEYHIQKHKKYLNQEIQENLKKKIRGTCKNYSKLKIPHKYKNIIDKLSKNTEILIMTQDVG